MGYGYVFSGMNWLCGGVWYADTPPFAQAWYVVVPNNNDPPKFHYGLDSMCHIDVAEYIKWIKSLNLW